MSLFFPLTLAHSVFLVLPLAVLFFISSSSSRPPSQKNNSEPCLTEASPNSSLESLPMPSLSYQPPATLLGELNYTTPSHALKEQFPTASQEDIVGVKQSYDAFLVLDVEATCFRGTGFEWPNEIIEWPVCLLRWKDKSIKGRATQLEIVDEFRSFVKPTWRPQLSQFCTDLTGIIQAQVDYAPMFPKVLKMFARFLVQHGLIDPRNGKPLQRFCWCSDGPFDVSMPSWLRGDVLDVRKVVSVWAAMNRTSDSHQINPRFPTGYHFRSLNITQQLRALRLGPFLGRMHCGIDDTRNIARIVIELARRGIRLEPNTPINPNRRWQWMGRPGEVLEYCLI